MSDIEPVIKKAAVIEVMLSHADFDHYGWISEVLRGTQVSNVWMGGDPDEYEKTVLLNVTQSFH